MRFFAIALGLALVSAATGARAGVCEVKVKRVACAGKEAESYKKCDGKQECTNKKKADSDAACQKLAEDECSNTRLDITKSKEIWATFAGKPLKNGANVCAPDRQDFNKCP